MTSVVNGFDKNKMNNFEGCLVSKTRLAFNKENVSIAKPALSVLFHRRVVGWNWSEPFQLPP